MTIKNKNDIIYNIESKSRKEFKVKQRFLNQVIVEGYIFDHTLTHRITGEKSKNPGQQYINGVIQIATDETGTNVIPVHFNYVVPEYKSGNANRTYQVLSQLIDSASKFTEVGDKATKVKVTGSVEANDFLGRDGQMVCSKRIGGSFCDIIQSISDDPAHFDVEMLITSTRTCEVENGDDYLELNGYCFNFRGDLLPVTFSVVNPKGMEFFESQSVSEVEPMFSKVWGKIVSTVVKREETVESDWGEPEIKVSSRTFTAWNVVGSSNNVGEFDDESTITKDEYEAARKARVEYVANEKARQEEYRNTQSGKAGFPEVKSEQKAASPTAAKDFVF